MTITTLLPIRERYPSNDFIVFVNPSLALTGIFFMPRAALIMALETTYSQSELPPDHLIHNSNIALDNLYNLSRDILLNVVRNRNAVVAILIHGNCGVNGL